MPQEWPVLRPFDVSVIEQRLQKTLHLNHSSLSGYAGYRFAEASGKAHPHAPLKSFAMLYARSKTSKNNFLTYRL